jgi:hypothetical protein
MEDYDSKLRALSSAAYSTPEARQNFANDLGFELLVNKGEASVYKDEKAKKIIIANRGTNKMKDLSADVALGLGLEAFHPRFQRSKALSESMRKQYEGYEIVQTGHSLGGALAESSAKKNDRVVTFNKGAGIMDLIRPRKRKETDYTHVLDPVSFLSTLQRGGKNVKKSKLTLNPHSLVSPLFKKWQNSHKNIKS